MFKNKSDGKKYICEECNFILVDAYVCKNKCSMYCKDHLPPNKKCQKCDGELIFDEKLTNEIKRCKVSCLSCYWKMRLEEFDYHMNKEIEKKCKKCDERVYSCKKMQIHKKEDCINRVIECMGVGCTYSSRRGEMLKHEKCCKNIEKTNQFLLPLKKEIDLLKLQFIKQAKIIEEQEKKINIILEKLEKREFDL